MNSFEHTTTFLRSALARDPFCLGDLGPEDVLRIEAEFPNLFATPPPRRASESRIQRPANGSPYAVPLIPKKPAQTRIPSKGNLKNNFAGPYSNDARRFQRPTSNGHPPGPAYNKKPLVQRGSAAFMKPYFPQPTTRNNHKTPTMRPVPSFQEDSSGRLLNKFTEELLISRQKLEEATLALKETQSRISNRLSQYSLKDSSTSSAIPNRNVTLLEMTTIEKSPNKLPISRPKLVRNPKPHTKSAPQLGVEPKSPRSSGRKGDTSGRPEIKQVKFKEMEPEPEPEPTSDILKSQARKLLSKVKNAPGFIRPTLSYQGIGRSNPKGNVKRTITNGHGDFPTPTPAEDHITGDRKLDTKENHGSLILNARSDKNEFTVSTTPNLHPKGIDEETLPTLLSSSESESGSVSTVDTPPLWFSPLQISSRMTAEEMGTKIAERQELERESTEKFEQLLFARLLASKYEQEGKFQKNEIVQEQSEVQNSRTHDFDHVHKLAERGNGKLSTQANKNKKKTTLISGRETFHRRQQPSPRARHGDVSSETTSILERIAADLIRAEVLKCIHTEEMNAKIDIGVGTENGTPLLSAANSQEQSLNMKLSTISEGSGEERLIVTTPELTPPQQIRRKPTPPPFDHQESQVTSLSLRTPELTPARENGPRLYANNNNKKINPETPNRERDDLTDCSSISDFVFSEIIPVPVANKISRRVNVLAELPDLPTPNMSPPVSKRYPEKDYNIESNGVSPVKTPAASVSGSAVRFTLPNSDRSDRSPSVHSFVPRSRSAARSHSRSRQESLESRSKNSIPDLTESPSSVGTGLASTDFMSEGEFLGVPYKSPGEVSWSLSLSPGIYLSNNQDDDSENSSSEESQELGSEDFLRAEISEGEVRSRDGG